MDRRPGAEAEPGDRQAPRDAETGYDIAYYGDARYVGWGGGLPVVIGGAVVGRWP